MTEAWAFTSSYEFAWLPRRLSRGGWGWLRMVHVFVLLHVDRNEWVPSSVMPSVLMPKVLERTVIVD